ncbi:unnamed protein product [Brassicogethes aeneus]|uniref:ATP synthase mitochondrial F1 complex assembly factor 1 n=1 Tax=Brassicogethes aeneus TaxID=1431903 RepID=A0A9P0FGJ9_BRAAE|nr:unnamed protein product [Brassicogethes aeneus]
MRLTYFRTLLYRGTFRLSQNTNKNIMTSPRNMQEVMEELKHNPYYDKYAKKIDKLQKVAPDEFSSRVETIAKTPKAKIEPTKERQFTQLLNPKQKIVEPVEVPEAALDKIMKVELIQDKTAEEIKEIWHQYHMDKEFISATIPTKEFNKLIEKGKKYPLFLLPLPRSQGYEFIMMQFERNSVHFTPLLHYQVHKENAPECLTIHHYTEFKDSKGVVLMRGEYDKNVVDAKEAQCLANLLKLYYCEEDPDKNKLLEVFTTKPDEFKHQDLIKNFESITL